MALSSFTVVVGQERVPITPTGPANVYLKVGSYQTGIVVGGPSVTLETGYPLSHGEEYKFRLESDDQVFGLSYPGESDTVVHILIEPGTI